MSGAGYELGRFNAKQLWRLQIRYRLARRLIYAGIYVMPDGRYKTELLDGLWALYDKVCAHSNGDRA